MSERRRDSVVTAASGVEAALEGATVCKHRPARDVF